MGTKRTNRFDVQIAFPSGAAFGLRSTSEKPLTPQDVVDELKWFIDRAEKVIARQKKRTQPNAEARV